MENTNKILGLLKKNYLVSFLLLWLIGSTVGVMLVYSTYQIILLFVMLLGNLILAALSCGILITLFVMSAKIKRSSKTHNSKELVITFITMFLSFSSIALAFCHISYILDLAKTFDLEGAIWMGALMASGVMVKIISLDF